MDVVVLELEYEITKAGGVRQPEEQITYTAAFGCSRDIRFLIISKVAGSNIKKHLLGYHVADTRVELSGTPFFCQHGLEHALEVSMIFCNREAPLSGGHNSFNLFKNKMWWKRSVFSHVGSFMDNLKQFERVE
jgi:hypothetical protein